MNESFIGRYETNFSPEKYSGKVIDIVHIDSVRRVAEGKKPADISDRKQAKKVLERVEALQAAGISLRFIEDLHAYEDLDEQPSSDNPLILGGAFMGQCIAEYQKTLNSKGIVSKIDPLLIVRTG